MHDQSAHDALFSNPDYHDLIGLIYDAITSRDGFFPFLKRFVEVFNGHSGSFSIFDPQTKTPLGYWVINIPEQALTFYIEHVSHQDALIEAALAERERRGLHFVASNLDIENMKEIRERTRAGEWLESYGAHEAAGAIAFQSENYLNFFGIQRSIDQPAFSREELAVFDIFLPHINRAVELYTKMSALDLASFTPERAALNHVQQGILICDATFKVVFINSTANAIVANNKGLHLSKDGLLSFRSKEFSWEFTVSLSTAIRASMESADSADKVLCYRHGKQNLTVIVSPLTTLSAEATEGSYRGGAMISLYDWANRPSISPELLQRFFNLSPAESRVSALLLNGHSPSDIAERLNRSRETIKSHLTSIYRKTNTSRQGELLALLAASRGLG